jgi:hydroxymethylglutaryl-CoA reductase
MRDLDVRGRRERLAARLGIDIEAIERDLDHGGIRPEDAEKMVENAIGTLGLPFGLGMHFRVDDRDLWVPMVIEEPSVIAAASSAAKRVRAGGGFRTEVDPSHMLAQIEVHDIARSREACSAITAASEALLAEGARAIPGVVGRGGGPRTLHVRDLGDGMIVVDVVVDCVDAMGANTLNTLAEAIGPQIARLASGELGLRILSNDCSRRCVRVRAEVPFAELGGIGGAPRLPGSGGTGSNPPGLDGSDVARRVRLASQFAERDPHRAVTHNKGIMNGVDAVVVATGNDWRAVEAAAHAYASRTGTYRPLATWREDNVRRVLVGELVLPLAVGIVGGALRAHRGARFALGLLGVTKASELASIAASVGLASNLAALRALATEGIQRGHMALHRRALPGGA